MMASSRPFHNRSCGPGDRGHGPGRLKAMIAYTPVEVAPSSGDVPVSRWLRSVWGSWRLWLVVVSFICAAHLLDPDGVLGNITYLLITCGAAVVAWLGSTRQRPQLRSAWGLVAVGVTCSAGGDLIYYVSGLVNGTLWDVSIADAFWLLAYVALAHRCVGADRRRPRGSPCGCRWADRHRFLRRAGRARRLAVQRGPRHRLRHHRTRSPRE